MPKLSATGWKFVISTFLRRLFSRLSVKRGAYYQARTLPCFDEVFYLKMNPDVAASSLRADQHFLSYGWKEGRNPCRYFNIAGYLEKNKDVRAAEINPLVHFLENGFAEGRTGWECSQEVKTGACVPNDLDDRPTARLRKEDEDFHPATTPRTRVAQEPWASARAELTSVILGYDPP